MPRTLGVVVIAALLGPAVVDGQMHHRLKGSLRTTANVPLVNAAIRADAITGFRGEPFAGAKEQATTSQASGEWHITNLEAGLWMFSASAPDMVPAAIVIPVKFSQRQQVSAIGNAINWQLPLWAMPLSEHQMLKTAIDLLAAGKTEAASQALTVALGPDVKDDTRVAAGEMALITRQHALAKLGLASATLMALQWEAAGKLVWEARDLVPKEQRPALAAAIDDLRGIARVQ